MPADHEEDHWTPGPVLPQHDRSWRHPTELFGPPAPSSASGDDRIQVSAMVTATIVIALLALGLYLLF